MQFGNGSTTTLPSLMNSPAGSSVSARAGREPTNCAVPHQLNYVKPTKQLLPPTPSASSTRSVRGKNRRIAQLPVTSTPTSVSSSHGVSSHATRKTQQMTEQQREAALSAQILARTHDDMHRTGDVRWGCGRLGSATDKPLVGNSAGSSSHKPPLLTTMENSVSRNLSALNAKAAHRNAEYLLPTSLPNHIQTAPPEVQQYPLGPQALPEEHETEPPGGAQAISMLYNSLGHGDATPVKVAGGVLPPATKRRSMTAESEASFAGTEMCASVVSLAPSCLEKLMMDDGGVTDKQGRQFAYRVERLLIFRKLSKQFAAAFHTYRPMLTWIMDEHISLLELLIENVDALKTSNCEKADEIAHLKAALAKQERESQVNLKMKEREMLMAVRKMDTAQSELKAAEAKCRVFRKEIDQLEETLGDTDETKRRLQRHVLQLEKRLDKEGLLNLEENFQRQKEQALAGLLDEIDELTNHNQVSQRENYHLKLQIRELEERKRGLKSEAELEHLTPRPDWRSSPIVDQFRYVGCTANSVQAAAELMYEMEQELLELRHSEKIYKRKWFLGLGTGEDVPAFLRYDGKIKNMQLRKTALETHITMFWKFRENTKKSIPITEAFTNFVVDRYGDAKLIDWTYNIYYSLHRYQDDPDCMIFLNILQGEIDESVWHDELELLDKLRDHMIMLDHGQNGALPIDSLMTAVRKTFPVKPEDNVELLAKSLEPQLNPENEIVYITLFEDDEDSHQSEFIEMLRKQNIEEREMYLWELAEAIADVDQGDGVITGHDFVQAIKSVDPDMPSVPLSKLLQHVFSSIVDSDAESDASSTTDEEEEAAAPEAPAAGAAPAENGEEKVKEEAEIEEREARLEDIVASLKTFKIKRYTKPAAFAVKARKTRITTAPPDPVPAGTVLSPFTDSDFAKTPKAGGVKSPEVKLDGVKLDLSLEQSVRGPSRGRPVQDLTIEFGQSRRGGGPDSPRGGDMEGSLRHSPRERRSMLINSGRLSPQHSMRQSIRASPRHGGGMSLRHRQSMLERQIEEKKEKTS